MTSRGRFDKESLDRLKFSLSVAHASGERMYWINRFAFSEDLYRKLVYLIQQRQIQCEVSFGISNQFVPDEEIGFWVQWD